MENTQNVTLTCPACGVSSPYDLRTTVNVDEEPKLLDAIRSFDVQRVRCASCDEAFIAEAPFLFVWPSRGLLVQVNPRQELSRWREIEATLARYDDKLIIPERPVEETVRRLVFGLNQLNEKIFCFERSLDDRLIEPLKLALLNANKDLEARIIGTTADIYTEGLDANDIVFLAVYNQDDKPQKAQVRVPKKFYDKLSDDESFLSQFTEMHEGWFVSWLRFFEVSGAGSA
jgi:hypothetical protein